MKTNAKAKTKGLKAQIDFGHKKATFTAGGRKRVEIAEGVVMVNGVVRLADGSEYHALLEIDEMSSGEHGGTGIFAEGRLVFQDDADFLEALGKKEAEVFPYKYKYSVALNCHDHHVGEDGWSRM
jgi:hypothetical protein